MSRYAIIAATITGNRGAEAMLEATVGRLRDHDPSAEIIVYSYAPSADARVLTDPSVRIHSSTPANLVLVHLPLGLIAGLFRLVRVDVSGLLPASVRDLSRSDALVDLAGVSFIDGREKYLPFNILTIWPAMLMGVPVFKLSQAVGPFRRGLNRWAAQSFLTRCRMLVPRGQTTAEHVGEIDIPAERVFPAPDTAFCFRERDALSDEGAEEIGKLRDLIGADRREGVVGICPSSVIAAKAAKEGWDYVGFLAEVARTCVADGRLVVLFPNATRADAGDALRNNDLPVIRDVAAATGLSASDGLLWVEGDANAAQLRRLVRVCDVVGVSRFHAMIGALAESVPVAVMGWSHKYAEVMDSFGMAAWCFDYSDHDPYRYIESMRSLFDARADVSAAIEAHLTEMVEASEAQYSELVLRM